MGKPVITRAATGFLVAFSIVILIAEQGTRSASLAPLDLTAIEKAFEERRTAEHVPGAALILVKEDKIILLKGFGLRDIEHKAPVTPDTLFAIGSCTKSFTALLAVMSADEGRLSLDDSPR